MPCDSIQLNRVDVAKMSPELLRAAQSELEEAGYRVILHNGATGRTIWTDKRGNRVTLDEAELTSTLPRELLAKFRNTLAQAYSRQAVLAAAKRNGWRVRMTAKNQYEVQR